jgi:hypothetical protein
MGISDKWIKNPELKNTDHIYIQVGVKTIISVFFLLSSFQVVLSQQFNFDELIKMSKSQKYFEQNMYAVGNDVVNIENQGTGYTYNTYSGATGACKGIPTRDPKMEAKFRFSNGEILTESQVNKKYSMDQRNKLANSGKMTLVKGPQNNYEYIPDLETFEISTTTISKFAENYDRIKETAHTFYEHWIDKRINNEGEGPITYHHMLSIQYNNDSDYKNSLKQIQSSAQYKGTRKLLKFLYVDFTYEDISINNICEIWCSPSNENQGGTIHFTWYDLRE